VFAVRCGLLILFPFLECRVLLKFDVLREFIVSDSAGCPLLGSNSI
jgi:hypothetical protein